MDDPAMSRVALPLAGLSVAAALSVALADASIGSDERAAVPEQVWRANAAAFVTQLRGDVVSIQRIEPSRHALTDISDQLVLLVAYTDLAGCSRMAARTGAPLSVVETIRGPCAQLERASRLFTRAEIRSDPLMLARADLEAGADQTLLARAALDFAGS
jgi:hypothetical protein